MKFSLIKLVTEQANNSEICLPNKIKINKNRAFKILLFII